MQGALLFFLVSTGSPCPCIASLVRGLDKSPFSRARRGACWGVSPWVVPIGGARHREGHPFLSREEPSPAQTERSPGALWTALLALHPLPAERDLRAFCEHPSLAGASSYSDLPGSGSLACRQGGEGWSTPLGLSGACRAVPRCAVPCRATLCRAMPCHAVPCRPPVAQ